MSGKSAIEWTNATWNPVTGCTKVSAGCKHCYAERIDTRFHRDFFRIQLHGDRLPWPRTKTKPRMIFVNSMSDLFHDQVPLDFIRRVFDVMVESPQHTFQVLTKRSLRVRALADKLPWPENLWMGVSVENAAVIPRIHDLAHVPATVRFVSFEPLIGPVGTIPVSYVHWAIVGGESGPKSRPMHPAWARQIRDQCVPAAVAFFFKQWGNWRPMEPLENKTNITRVHVFDDGQAMFNTLSKKRSGRELDGRTWDEYPERQ